MPIYCYHCKTCGAAWEEFFPIKIGAPQGPPCPSAGCPGPTARDLQVEMRSQNIVMRGESRPGVRRGCAKYPYWSDALGIHPAQIPEVTAHHAAHGVPTEFNPEGQAGIQSKVHREKLCKLCGFAEKH